MAVNEAVNKIEFNNNTIFDLTGDNVTANDVKQGVHFHLPDGTQAIGTNTGGGGTPWDESYHFLDE